MPLAACGMCQIKFLSAVRESAIEIEREREKERGRAGERDRERLCPLNYQRHLLSTEQEKEQEEE